ncbi:hypothetical protein F4678DRAFT_458061 [Xylaria arbuscula]|nr:hypothetical protein F4678DRAFT_458061 [Xylaria arbuscula]
MAPPRHNNGGPLPRSFTCRVCGKDKPHAEYSPAQIQKWYKLKRQDQYNTVNPHTAGLTCKVHSSQQREIRCEGPCGLIKLVDRFSKAQRNNSSPWCIMCTEWKESNGANEIPTAPPGERLTRDEYRGNNGDDDDNGFQLSVPQPSFDGYGTDDDDDESSDDDSEGVSPYGGEAEAVTKMIDRLQGYSVADTDEGITADTASTTDMGYSGWGGDDVNVSTGSAYGNPARTLTSMPAGAMQNRNASYLQGYASAGNRTATSAGGARPPTGSALGPATNHQSQMSRHDRLSQTSRFMGLGESIPNPSSRFSAGHPRSSQTSQDEIKRSAVALANEPPSGSKPAVKGRQSKENKWYKGDNRKVFPGKKMDMGARVQDGREATYDSDSPDEM